MIDPFEWLDPVILHDGQRARVIREDGDHIIVETDEIIDLDNDGDDEDGHPIMRPVYRRRRVPRDTITKHRGTLI